MKLVVTPHRPLRKALLTLAAVAAVGLALAVALDYGHWRAIARTMVSTGEKRSLLDEVATLRRENERLRYELERLERTEQINRTTREENHARLVEARARIAALTSDVRFYRDVVGAAEVGPGPRVGGLRFKALDGDGRYSYELVMTHLSRGNSLAEGSLRVDLLGKQKGQEKALGLADLVESGPSTLAFKFKRFHLFEGTIKIPADFVPRQVEVAIRGRSRADGAHTETYDWASVLN